MADFKPSLGYLAMTNKCGILPMYLDGTHDAMPKGRYLPKRGERVAAYIGPYLTYEDVAKLARRAHDAVEQYRAITQHVESVDPPARAARCSVDARRGRHDADGRVPRRRSGKSRSTETTRRTHEDRRCSSPARPGFSASICAACSSSRATSCAGSRARARRSSRSSASSTSAATCSSGDELDRALDGVSAVFHLAGAVSRDPDDGQRMMRLHVDGTRRVLERMAAAGVRRMVLASTSGTIGVSKRRGDPRRERAVRRGDRRRLAVLRVEDLPGAARVRARRAARHRGRRGQPVAAARARRSPAVVDRRRPQVHQAPDPDDPRRRHQLRRRARRRASPPRTRSSKGRAGERYLLGGPNWTTKEFFGAPRPRRERRAAAPQAARRAGTSGARRSSRSSIAGAARSRRSIASASRWPSTTGGSTRRKAERELGFAPRDPQLTLVDTVSYLRQGVDPELTSRTARVCRR